MATSAVINLVLKVKDQASGVLTSAATKVTALVAAFAGAVAIKETVHSLTGRGSLDTAVNEVKLKYISRDGDYNERTVIAQNNGLRIHKGDSDG